MNKIFCHTFVLTPGLSWPAFAAVKGQQLLNLWCIRQPPILPWRWIAYGAEYLKIKRSAQ